MLADRDESIIALDKVLDDFRQAELGGAWRARDEIMICPNMRAAQIHLRQPGAVLLDRVTRAALADARVDLVLTRQKLAPDGSDVYVPPALRTVDLAPLCTALVGSPMRYAVGVARRLTHALG